MEAAGCRLPAADLTVEGGVVSHPSGPRAHYGELARVAAATPPGDVRRKPTSAWKLVGTPAPRIDVASKCDGSARFGIDVREQAQLYAVVRHCPMLGGGIGAVDVDAALRRPGVERVVRLGSYAGSTAAVAVVGRTTWHAREGARALAVAWQAPPAGALDSRAIEAELLGTAKRAAAEGGGFHLPSAGRCGSCAPRRGA